jgi:ferritin-like metal-binding protein YciE
LTPVKFERRLTELGHDEIVRFLMTNLNEEKAANTKLNTVALRKGVNAKASTAA